MGLSLRVAAPQPVGVGALAGLVARVGDAFVVVGHGGSSVVLCAHGDIDGLFSPRLIPWLWNFSLSVKPSHTIPPIKNAPR